MSNFEELEIKILNVNAEEMISKLNEIGAIYKKECVQKIYTYDCYDVSLLYNLAINDYKITLSKNSLLKIANICSQFEVVLTDLEKSTTEGICGFKTINEYILNDIENVDISVLENNFILELIKNVGKRFFKWIRLRKSGEKIELTVKYIYNTSANYDMDQVKEVEINVSDFETANRIIEEMGYYRKKLVEKKRTSFDYNGVRIEIDEWPLINSYIEIEGDTEEEIYNTVEKLGYTRRDALVMNTDDVYLMKGIDLNSYEVLTFDEQKLI